MRISVLVGITLALLLIHGVSALSISCDDVAAYSHGVAKFSCGVSGIQNDSIVRVYGYSSNVQLFYRDFYVPLGGKIEFNASFQIKDIAPEEFRVFPSYTFANVRVPIYINAEEIRKNTTTTKDYKAVLRLKPSLKSYLPLLWALLVILVFFSGPTMDYKSGWDFAIDVLGLQLIFRAGGFWDVSAPFVYVSVSSKALTDLKIGHSLLALSGLSALFLLQSAYALGFHKAKYPKVSFYTGFEWIIGLPIALYFVWPEHYVTPLFLGFLIGIPLFIILWKYAELPYSKCHKALSLFKTYSVPLSAGVALVLALQYTTEETISLLAVFLVSLFIYTLTSKLAFDKLEWAKKKFDEDIERIRGESKTI